jgi:uncharacterized protein (DUF2384 family)
VVKSSVRGARRESQVRSDFGLTPEQKSELINRGVPAARISELAQALALPKGMLLAFLGISRSMEYRRVRAALPLSPDESERILGIEALIREVEAMVEESISVDPADFGSGRWLGQWLRLPMPALGGASPASYLDTAERQKVVLRILSMVRGGSYG